MLQHILVTDRSGIQLIVLERELNEVTNELICR